MADDNGTQPNGNDRPKGEEKSGKAINTGVTVLVVLFVLACLIGFIQQQNGTQSAATSESTTRTLRGTYWCGVDLDNAVQVSIAVRNSDTAGLAGLLAREKAFQVETGTTVSAGTEIESGVLLVTIRSGSQMGRNCYIPKNALQ